MPENRGTTLCKCKMTIELRRMRFFRRSQFVKKDQKSFLALLCYIFAHFCSRKNSAIFRNTGASSQICMRKTVELMHTLRSSKGGLPGYTLVKLGRRFGWLLAWPFLLCGYATVVSGTMAIGDGSRSVLAQTQENQTAHSTETVAEYIREHGFALDSIDDLQPLLEKASQSRLVLLGEASHGTSEYYVWRAEISRRLIEEYGFDFVLVEGDWPLAIEVNRHVKHLESEQRTSREVLQVFHRWPQWMWANEEVLDLVAWMREHNRAHPPENRSGFYGMDMYAATDAMQVVNRFLSARNGDLARQADRLYGCFTRFRDPSAYLNNIRRTGEDCSEDIEQVYSLVREHEARFTELDSLGYVNALKSARMMVYYERHTRANLQSGPGSWNARVDFFHDTAQRLLERYGPDSRGIVWAHNTHIGDARATTMANSGMKNIGQLARETYGMDQVFAVGFGTYRGTVLAGRRWEGPMQQMQIPDAVQGSYEEAMYRSGISPLLLMLHDSRNRPELMEPRGNRAVGVVYNPARDSQDNFVPTILPLRYDAFLFFSDTQALSPLE